MTVAKPAFLCFLLAAGLFLSACKQESKVAAGSDPTGVYALVSVSGNKVPATITHDGVALQVRSGTFTIKADGTCSTKTAFVPPPGPENTLEVRASGCSQPSSVTAMYRRCQSRRPLSTGTRPALPNRRMRRAVVPSDCLPHQAKVIVSDSGVSGIPRKPAENRRPLLPEGLARTRQPPAWLPARRCRAFFRQRS
jgi:hypothetical protein